MTHWSIRAIEIRKDRLSAIERITRLTGVTAVFDYLSADFLARHGEEAMWGIDIRGTYQVGDKVHVVNPRTGDVEDGVVTGYAKDMTMRSKNPTGILVRFLGEKQAVEVAAGFLTGDEIIERHPPSPRDMFTSDYRYDEIVAAATETYWVIPINTDDQNFGRWWRIADRSKSGMVHYEQDHR
jgi:hypothetical protein